MTDHDPLLPVSDDAWPESVADLRRGFAGGLNVYRVMAHHPALLKAWSDLREHVVNRSSLGRERSEVVILRTAVRLGSGYEWSHHVVRSRKRGFDDGRIRSMRGSPDQMAPADALLATAVDELQDHAELTSKTRVRLMAEVGPQGVLDLIATVGFYTTLAFIQKSFATPLDEDIVTALRAAPIDP